MKNTLRYAFVAVCVLTLAGCSGMELGEAEGLSPKGSNFSKALYGGYLKLSRAEFGESDYVDSDTFALRAKAAAGGGEAGPEEIAARKLPANKVGALSDARARLVKGLGGGGPCPIDVRMLDAGAGREFPAQGHRAVQG